MTDIDNEYEITNMEAAKEAVAMLPRLKEITERQEVAARKIQEGTLWRGMGEMPQMNMQVMLLQEATEGYKLCSDLEFKLGLAAEDDPEQLAKLTAISYRPVICQQTAGPEAINEYRDLSQRFSIAANIVRENIRTPSYSSAPTGSSAPTEVRHNPTEKNSTGLAALVLGILSFCCLGILAGIPAIILGMQGRQAADEGRATNKGVATAGMALGIIGTVFVAIIITRVQF